MTQRYSTTRRRSGQRQRRGRRTTSRGTSLIAAVAGEVIDDEAFEPRRMAIAVARAAQA
jgi:hypothetical protein